MAWKGHEQDCLQRLSQALVKHWWINDLISEEECLEIAHLKEQEFKEEGRTEMDLELLDGHGPMQVNFQQHGWPQERQNDELPEEE